jgi:hypothetical protein
MLWLRGLRATAAQRPPREPPIWNMFSPYEQWKHFNIERDREMLGERTTTISSFFFVALGRLSLVIVMRFPARVKIYRR